MNANKLLLGFLVLLLSACASRPEVRNAERSQNQVDDFQAEQTNKFFSKSMAHKLFKAIDPDQVRENGPSRDDKIRKVLCNGSHPTVTPRYSFIYNFNVKEGAPLDIAAEQREKDSKEIIESVKNSFLYNSGRGVRDPNFLYIPTCATFHWLMNNFTFLLPASKPSEAIDNREDLWRSILAESTTVKVAPTSSGELKFEVALDLTPFCTYGISLKKLEARSTYLGEN